MHKKLRHSYARTSYVCRYAVKILELRIWIYGNDSRVNEYGYVVKLVELRMWICGTDSSGQALKCYTTQCQCLHVYVPVTPLPPKNTETVSFK